MGPKSIVETALARIEKKLDKLTATVKRNGRTASKAYDLATKHDKEIAQLKNELAQTQDRTRRKNLRLFGFPGGEAPTDLKKIIVDWIVAQGIQLTEQDIERAHRSFGTGRNQQQPKQIVIAFSSESCRDQVFKSLKQKSPLTYQDKIVFVKQDLSKLSLDIKKSLLPAANRLYQKNIRFSWILPMGLLIIKDGRRYIARSPEQADQMLQDLGLEPIQLQQQQSEESSDQEEEETSDSDADVAGASAPRTRGEKAKRKKT